ncbi:MAG: cytochrome c3 family protein [Hyphomicrobiaceae bacterium]|nr:cytochrome c3 family protein [Hyphomicrobiaceae bacterium]
MCSQWTRVSRTVAAILAAMVLMLTVGVGAAQAGPPKPAKGRGEACVAPTDWMRRYHMTVLHHQRDDTVHEGIRTQQFSLKGCIDCHQVKGSDDRAVTVADPKHFCRTCHDYAAVRVDCFECHASRPGEGDKAAVGRGPPAGPPHAHGPAGPAASGAGGGGPGDGVTALEAYLKEVGR